MIYDVVIGLEVHAELNTKTKIFCSCKNEFGLEVNTLCCPICMGMPGSMPSLNEKVVEYAVKTGLAFNCDINKTSKSDRKNYHYPDLPKAYQISQSDVPLCENGYLNILVDGKKKRIGITRIHIEEDTGKLLHDVVPDATLIDYNRCGVPLIEIVTEPDIRSSAEAKAFLDTIKSSLVALGVSDAKMQEGSVRCDVNVSVMPKGSDVYGTRCEMKNISTFSGAVKAIEYESQRQIDIINSGGTLSPETLRWDDAKGISVPMRVKKVEFDERYLPETDLKAFTVSDKLIDELKNAIPELPFEKSYRYMQEFSLSQNDAFLLAYSPERAKLFENVMKNGKINAKNVANRILVDITGYLNEHNVAILKTALSPTALYDMVKAVDDGEISNASGKIVLTELLENGGIVSDIIKAKKLSQISDTSELESIVTSVIEANQKSVEDYKNGKTNALGFLVGQCMKATKGKGNPAMMKEMVLGQLK